MVPEGSGRKRRYAAVERLYSICYKLRRERDEAAVVHNLVRFMGVFYGDAEMAELSDELNAEAARSPAIREGIRRAMEEFPLGSGLSGQGWLALQHTSSGVGAIRDGRGELSSAERETEGIVETAKQLLKLVEQGRLHESEAAIAACDEVIKRFGRSESLPLRTEVAKALYNKGVVQAWTGASEAAIATHDEVIERFGDSNADEIRVTVPEPHALVAAMLLVKGAAQGELGQPEASIATCNELVRRFGDSEVPQVMALVAEAFACKGERQVETGCAPRALQTCEELDRRLGALTGRRKLALEWQTGWVRMQAHLLQGGHAAATDAFRSIYAAFLPGDEKMMRQMLAAVPDLITAGAAESDLVEILSSDREKSAGLLPLVVALRERLGQTVRAPIEVIEVASDIRERIGARVDAGTSPAPGEAVG